MSGKRVNVLVYAGGGATLESVRHATWSLRRLLGPNHAVLTVTGDQILKEPWAASCALLVMPGGADLGYCRTLDGQGNRRIKQYVLMGGAYLGLCAGGYYGTARCEFEAGKQGMEVIGDRELGFFPGICRGLPFPGFVYHSEAGTRAADLKMNQAALPLKGGTVAESFRAYYNGGGVFVDAEKYADRGVEVLASYTEELAVHSGEARAAVVYCKVGEGRAILTGPHPEFSGTNLSPNEPSGHHDYPSVVSALLTDEKKRVDFMKACLTKLGLDVSQEAEAVPSLSRLHLSSSQPSQITELLHSWQANGILAKDDDGRETIKGENDSFIVEQPGRWDMGGVTDALPAPRFGDADKKKPGNGLPADSLLDYSVVPKRLVTHEEGMPDSKETPHFNHHAFYANLQHYNTKHTESDHAFGKVMLYGEIVTSTNTLLDKNPSWLAHLPNGLTATATTQVAGRGRGTNVWVSPPGSLMFSTVLRHSLSLSTSAPVVFVQYLAALAIVAGIHGYDQGYQRLPVKLKWPNDIYALDPTAPESEKKYVKIGGILVNSSYAGGDYTLVCGIGLNVTNAAPTTSLSLLAKKLGLAPFTLEKLLASILTQFEELYTGFCRTGFNQRFLDTYYASWLHTDQIVTLETEGGARARIMGITSDWGLLIAEELGWEDRPTGKKFSLQSDSNSFDFFKGLLKRKI
ncbi:biotin holocarboxylase synthetase [Elasticomyces elasticus]|nr:biotin holocarboxylase synthetase [Elasticomyces elasticus]